MLTPKKKKKKKNRRRVFSPSIVYVQCGIKYCTDLHHSYNPIVDNISALYIFSHKPLSVKVVPALNIIRVALRRLMLTFFQWLRLLLIVDSLEDVCSEFAAALKNITDWACTSHLLIVLLGSFARPQMDAAVNARLLNSHSKCHGRYNELHARRMQVVRLVQK